MADSASPLYVHPHTLLQVRADRFCKFFPYLHAMPYSLLVPFPQEVFVGFIHRDREVGYDVAVLGLSYHGMSAKPSRHGHFVELALPCEPHLALCRTA